MQLEEEELRTLGTSTPDTEFRLGKALPDFRFLFFAFLSPLLKTFFNTSIFEYGQDFFLGFFFNVFFPLSLRRKILLYIISFTDFALSDLQESSVCIFFHSIEKEKISTEVPHHQFIPLTPNYPGYQFCNLYHYIIGMKK